MKIVYASFHITHRGKMYRVSFDVQNPDDKASCHNVTVAASDGKVIDVSVTAGRQVVSPWNAKQFLKTALEKSKCEHQFDNGTFICVHCGQDGREGWK